MQTRTGLRVGVSSLVLLTLAWTAEALPHTKADETYVIGVTPAGKSYRNPFAKELVDVSELCLETGCVRAASKLLDKMDFEANPCEDFFEFSCGKYVRETLIPDDQVSVTTFNVIRDELKEKMRLVLDQPIDEAEIPPFKAIKQLFRMCMNKTAVDKLGAEPLLDLFRGLGGFPVLDSEWNEGNFTWFDMVKRFRMMGISVDYIFDFSVSIDLSNSKRRLIEFDQPSFRIAREYIVQGLNHTNVAANLKYMEDIMVLLGANNETAAKDMTDALEFEVALARITAPKEERRNATLRNNPITLKELQAKYSWLDWYGYISAILPPEIAVGEDEVINIQDLKFFDQLGDLLTRTPKRTLANFLLTRLTGTSVTYLSSAFRKRQLEYQTVVYGKTEEEPRSKECVETVLTKLPSAASALYVRKHFNQESRKTAVEMVEHIKKEFASNLEQIDWMDAETKVEARSKLDDMSSLIGYPEELDNDTLLAEYYKDLEVVPDRYFETSHKITSFLSDLSYRKLREPVVKDDWKTWGKAAQVNAFYNRAHNHIRFPAGILQGHFFAADRPKYLNYAAIGTVIGHEITHGFDDQGRQFDAKGNLRDWWNPQTAENFKSRAACIIEQFSATLDPQTNLTLNGIATQGENIADMGGIRNAYAAYKRFQEKNGKEQQLPGLQQFTSEQIFWVALAQNWCSKYRDEALKLQISRNVHAPGKYRVLLPLKSNKEFAADFGCPLNSPMNPEKKCKLW